jgi:hypothetical protein
MTHDGNGGGWGVLAGSAVFLMQVMVLVPGLLAGVLLTAAFALPLLLLAIPAFALVAVYFAVRGLGRAVLRRR